MKIYKQIHRTEKPRIYDILNVPGSKTMKLDDGTELKIKRIIGSIVGVNVYNTKKGWGKSRLYQLIG
ncbi:MAG: hypothetical protein KQH59_01950 [Desulfobulbaceae bacterium]|nr:hypothetical protein [Desulfobulbaceae bacterium]